MCGRCGCVEEGAGPDGVRPAVVEGVLEPALLLLLSEQDGYGYELTPALSARGLLPRAVPPARVYETLGRLETAGAVRAVTEANATGPDRRCYHITPAGRDRLDRWAESIRQSQDSLTQLLSTYQSVRAGAR